MLWGFFSLADISTILPPIVCDASVSFFVVLETLCKQLSRLFHIVMCFPAMPSKFSSPNCSVCRELTIDAQLFQQLPFKHRLVRCQTTFDYVWPGSALWPPATVGLFFPEFCLMTLMENLISVAAASIFFCVFFRSFSSPLHFFNTFLLESISSFPLTDLHSGHPILFFVRRLCTIPSCIVAYNDPNCCTACLRLVRRSLLHSSSVQE